MFFEIYQDKANKWRWRLISKNGRIVAKTGQGYSRKDGCERAVDNVQIGGFCASVSYINP